MASCAELAEVLLDTEFAGECRELLAAGAEWTDHHLFNGEFKQQQVIPAGSENRIADGLRIRYQGDLPLAGSDDLFEPDLQIGSGCGSDQLVGHSMALLSGIDTGLDEVRMLTSASAEVPSWAC